MTDCPNGLIRDQLPEYAHGVLSAQETARVSAHLEECAECRAEMTLLGHARTVLDLVTPLVDAAAIVAALPAPRVHLRRGSRRLAMAPAWSYAAAAALVLAVGSTALWRSGSEEMMQRVADSSGTVAALSASGAPADTPLFAAAAQGVTFGGGLSDLSVEDLQSLLSQMDSVKMLPSSNPEPMTPVVAEKEGGKSL